MLMTRLPSLEVEFGNGTVVGSRGITWVLGETRFLDYNKSIN